MDKSNANRYGIENSDFNTRKRGNSNMRLLKKASFKKALKNLYPPYFSNKVTECLLDYYGLEPTPFLLDLVFMRMQEVITTDEIVWLSLRAADTLPIRQEDDEYDPIAEIFDNSFCFYD